MVEETEEEDEKEEEEEDGLEYATDTPLGGSYTTPPSTGGHSEPSPAPRDSNPENNTVLRTEELEAHIEAFLEEAEEDMEIGDMPPLENVLVIPVPAPVIPGFVPFSISTSQCCIPPKSLFKKVFHPYKDSVGQCRCESGSWCNDLSCSGQVQCVPRKIRGRGLSNGDSRSGRSCCHWGRGGLEPVITC